MGAQGEAARQRRITWRSLVAPSLTATPCTADMVSMIRVPLSGGASTVRRLAAQRFTPSCAAGAEAPARAQAEEEAARQRRLAAALRERLLRARAKSAELDARVRLLERVEAFACGRESACLRGYARGRFKETF